MGMQLFPAVLESTKETSPLVAFIDKLNRLEKMGAIPSVDQWLLLREMPNSFAHDYPDDPDLQVSSLNRAFEVVGELLALLEHIKGFATRYL
jgi:hypothetical protein